MTVSDTAAAVGEKNDYYDKSYFKKTFEHQRYAAYFDRLKFDKFVGPSDRVIDFGCGGGYILSGLDVKERVGVEVNEAAAAAARKNGIRVFGSLEEIEDGWADAIISHHALEHVDDPLGMLRLMFSKLRKGGKVVIVTPDESFKIRYREDDPNFHLFTWSPSNIGNLLKRAGFTGISASPIHHRWPRYWWIIGPIVGKRLMNLICIGYGRVMTGISQVRGVGYKP
ncbi:class I SAM-dependent methyltransferase [Neorhizobium sp. P12A]|uniref:class I SAM-dependent methyltransferase n=1 Tax=Neorhizobium sp. P12A TaxID=2268027 RepID=UPI00165DEF28|nr:class I SAM-dependent methyltransferase [Neorhizobium sp. P12A]